MATIIGLDEELFAILCKEKLENIDEDDIRADETVINIFIQYINSRGSREEIAAITNISILGSLIRLARVCKCPSLEGVAVEYLKRILYSRSNPELVDILKNADTAMQLSIEQNGAAEILAEKLREAIISGTKTGFQIQGLSPRNSKIVLGFLCPS